MLHRLQGFEPTTSDAAHGTVAAPAAAAAGVLLFAGEAVDTCDQQQVHGAMRQGKRAADQILDRIRQQAAQGGQ